MTRVRPQVEIEWHQVRLATESMTHAPQHHRAHTGFGRRQLHQEMIGCEGRRKIGDQLLKLRVGDNGIKRRISGDLWQVLKGWVAAQFGFELLKDEDRILYL